VCVGKGVAEVKIRDGGKERERAKVICSALNCITFG
jgi:hypothetical protein